MATIRRLAQPPAQSLLYAEPAARRWISKDGGDPRDMVRQQAPLISKPIERAQDLMLDKQGRLRGEFCLSELCFNSLCSLLGPGLGPLLMSLTGEIPAASTFRGCRKNPQLSLEAASKVWNEVLRTRFKSLRGRRLLFDVRAKVAVALVTPSFALIPNLRFYDAVVAWGETQRPILRPACVHMEARGLAVYLTSAASPLLFDTPAGPREPGRLGVVLSNSEAGSVSAYAARCVERVWSGCFFMEHPPRARRVMHLSTPEAVLQKVLRSAGDRRRGLAELRPVVLAGWLGAPQTPLPLGPNPAEYYPRLFSWIGERPYPLAKEYLQEVLLDLLLKGSFKGDVRDDVAPSHALDPGCVANMRQRTWFDLCVAMSRVAARHRTKLREEAEHLAFRLLTGEYLRIGTDT